MERQRIDAGAARYEITQDERVAAAHSSRIVRVTRAKGEMEVAMTKAHGEVEVARYEGRCGGETEVVTMTLLCEKELRNTTLEASTALSDAQAKTKASGFLAEAVLTGARAHGEAAVLLADSIRHKQRLRLAEIEATFASSGRKFLSGDVGKGILNSFVMVRGLLGQSVASSSSRVSPENEWDWADKEASSNGSVVAVVPAKEAKTTPRRRSVVSSRGARPPPRTPRSGESPPRPKGTFIEEL
mmetsp:Transcript_18604/g.42363  ORF Transcript_18604/g.42363 Transcript_18604/m.42363 type:complete len:243 (-) Transcript_18604:204-932(-)